MSRSPRSLVRNRESLCRKCGRCCREKVEVEGIVFYVKGYCRYLDTETKMCTVYEKRKTVNPECASIDDGIRRGMLPGNCPYVADMADYIAPVEEWDDPDLLKLIEEATQSQDPQQRGPS
jgi:uncharacterized protein